MISLETAKKLKEAGLKWEPEHGDWFHHNAFGHEIVSNKFPPEKVTEGFLWLPRLDQMLKEIDKAGRLWHLYVSDLDLPPYCLEIEKRCESEYFTADSPEEATAQALLWIYEQESRPTVCPYIDSDCYCVLKKDSCCPPLNLRDCLVYAKEQEVRP